MADVFLVRADNPVAVDEARSRARRRLKSVLPGLAIEEAGGTGWALVASRSPATPWSARCDETGAAVIVGFLLDGPADTATDLLSPDHARRLRAACNVSRNLNYGAAISVSGGYVVATADFFGLYPLYYWVADDACIVTSIPALAACWPSFRSDVDWQGLVGILLVGHSVLGRTLQSGVTRLDAGSILEYDARAGTRVTAAQRRIDSTSISTTEAAVEAFDHSLTQTLKAVRHHGVSTILLSGGLDSRIIAGYLANECAGTIAITAGDTRDLDMRAARGVARTIRARPRPLSVEEHRYVEFARREVESDAASSGLYAFHFWSVAEKAEVPLVNGFLGDPLMGASHVGWSREPVYGLHSFYALFRSINAWGFPPAVVRQLVRVPDVDDLILEVWKGLRDTFESYPGDPWRKTWWFDLLHRQRFLVGRVAKLFARTAWPIQPFTAEMVREVALDVPFEVLRDRRVQIDLLLRKFPALARLPLDRASYDTRSLFASQRTHLWTPFVLRGRERLHRELSRRLHLPDHRFHYRVSDFNNAGWRAVRDEARRVITASARWLDIDAAFALIPPGSVFLDLPSPMIQANGRKTLIGVLLAMNEIGPFASCQPAMP